MTKGGTVVKALITGATSGIGREMAKILAVRGVDLIIASRDEKKMKSLAKRAACGSAHDSSGFIQSRGLLSAV